MCIPEQEVYLSVYVVSIPGQEVYVNVYVVFVSLYVHTRTGSVPKCVCGFCIIVCLYKNRKCM